MSRNSQTKPGDTIELTYQRKGATAAVSATLRNEVVAKTEKREAQSERGLKEIYNKLGATFAPLTDDIKQRLSLNAGVLVTRVYKNSFFDQSGISTGTIIAFINGKPINNPNDIDLAILSA